MPDRGDTPPPIFWDDYKPYQDLSNEDKFKFLQHRGSWSLSQFLHGEQGALLVASQLFLVPQRLMLSYMLLLKLLTRQDM